MPPDGTELLDICGRIEKMTSELYYYFSEVYRDMPDLSRLWIQTAQEEENHMFQFQMAVRLSKSATFTTAVSTTHAQQALDMITGVQERVRKNPPTWYNALKLAIELEERMSRFHTDSALVFDDDTFNSLYQAMMKHDKDHVRALSRYLETPTDQEVS
jgi:rubrerythrin